MNNHRKLAAIFNKKMIRCQEIVGCPQCDVVGVSHFDGFSRWQYFYVFFYGIIEIVQIRLIGDYFFSIAKSFKKFFIVKKLEDF